MDQDISSKIFQFKITLKNIRPPIWRRIQVPADFNFRELHLSIQCAMGWYNSHLYEFRIKQGERFSTEFLLIGDPPADSFYFSNGLKTIDAKTVQIATHFPHVKTWCLYTYDFGDGWDHRVELEKILPKIKSMNYPICLAGKRGCPPENVGGTEGYYRHLDIVKNPQHPEYKEHMSFLIVNQTNMSDDPEKFDPKSVEFNFEMIDRELFYEEMDKSMYEKNLDKLFQFKITVGGVYPKIWRSIQIPGNNTFKELHHAIQHAMGWDNSEAYEFRVRKNSKYEELHINETENSMIYDVLDTFNASFVRLVDYFEYCEDWCFYEYNLENKNQKHRVELKDLLPKVKGTTYPICIAGSRNCLPKNIGATSGYLRHLEILGNQQHPDHKELMEWFVKNQTSDELGNFDVTTVNYDCQLFSASFEKRIWEELGKYTVLQLKIKLYSNLPVWRRIQVSGDFKFKELHYAIQYAMGWKNLHKYEFRVYEEGQHAKLIISEQDETNPVSNVKVTTLLQENTWCIYEYDFESFWKHRVELEKILPKEEGRTYPVCIEGSGICPPENVWGIAGYKKHLEIIKNSEHPGCEEHMESCANNGTCDNPKLMAKATFEECCKQGLFNKKIKNIFKDAIMFD